MSVRERLLGLLRALRDVWAIVGIVLAVVIGVEVILQVFVPLWQSGSPSTDPRVRADAYEDSSWVTPYFREFEASLDLRWEPYVYWRRRAYDGNYITVSDSGLRQTDNPSVEPDSDPRQLFVFGGSTVWGTGARDRHTVPSYLSRRLNRQSSSPVLVRNYGETGYVSSQDLVTLIKMLRNGTRPDTVVFYGGINDGLAACQGGRPGTTQRESRRQTEFNILKRTDTLLSQGLLGFWKQSGTYRFLETLGVKRYQILRVRNRSPIENVGQTADRILDIYRQNLDLVRALSEAYGFDAHFFWQPILYEKDHLTDYESDQLDRHPRCRPLFNALYEKIGNRSFGPGFHDLSDRFEDVRDPVFLDTMHLSETGNRMVAAAIVERIGAGAKSTARDAPSNEP